MIDPARPRVDPRLAARLGTETGTGVFGLVIRMAPGRQPRIGGLIEIGPDLWAGRLGADAIGRLATDEGVVFIEYAGSAPPDGPIPGD